MCISFPLFLKNPKKHEEEPQTVVQQKRRENILLWNYSKVPKHSKGMVKKQAMHLIRKHDPVPAFTKFVAGLKFKMITYLNSKNNYTSRNNIILGFDILPLWSCQLNITLN